MHIKAAKNEKILHGGRGGGKTAAIKELQNRLIAEKTVLIIAAAERMANAIRYYGTVTIRGQVLAARKELQIALKQYDEAMNHGK